MLYKINIVASNILADLSINNNVSVNELSLPEYNPYY